MNLNVGVCTSKNVAIPYVFGCLNIDIFKSPAVDVICDINNLPFKTESFVDVYCFHVLEHIRTPARGLSELIRVAKRMVELEVPHRWGMHAKTGPAHLFPRISHKNSGEYKGVQYDHVSSFRGMWFHRCLRNYKRCVKVLWEFPFDLLIHVWVYKNEWRNEKID